MIRTILSGLTLLMATLPAHSEMWKCTWPDGDIRYVKNHRSVPILMEGANCVQLVLKPLDQPFKASPKVAECVSVADAARRLATSRHSKSMGQAADEILKGNYSPGNKDYLFGLSELIYSMPTTPKAEDLAVHIYVACVGGN